MSSTRRDRLVGDVVDGRYEVLARVARGGMSTVHLALDRRLDREVALKVMHPHLAEDPALVRRFEAEAKTAARLSHPNVVSVLDQGHTPGPDGDVVAYLVMELVRGRTLRALIRAEAPMPPRRAVELLLPAVEGLAAAHRAGLAHRDVKPENVLVGDDGRVKVADFGLTRASTGHTTAGQALLGTPAYLAPELIRDGDADVRADLYAAGIILFEMLTGRQPYTADTALQVAYRHVHERVPPPSRHAPDVPEALDDLVLWCTEPDPADRPDDAGVLVTELRRLLDDLPAAPPRGEGGDVGERATEPIHVVRRAPAAEEAATEAFHRPSVHAAETVPVPAGSVHATDPTPTEPEATAAAPTTRPLSVRDGADDRSSRAASRPSTVAASSPRRPTVELGAGAGRTLAIGAAVTLLLAGVALLLGWTIGSGGMRPGQAAVMPVLEGLDQRTARARLAEAGVPVDLRLRHDERYSDGVVVGTLPVAGERLDPASGAVLTVSDGPAPVPAPDLAGLGLSEAARRAAAAPGRPGVEVVGRVPDTGVPAGAVVSQEPAAGAEAERGAPVEVVLSSGPSRRVVPDVAGLPLAEARRRLEDLGWTVETRQERGGPTSDRTVRAQGTPAGTELPEGARIQLTLE